MSIDKAQNLDENQRKSFCKIFSSKSPFRYHSMAVKSFVLSSFMIIIYYQEWVWEMTTQNLAGQHYFAKAYFSPMIRLKTEEKKLSTNNIF